MTKPSSGKVSRKEPLCPLCRHRVSHHGGLLGCAARRSCRAAGVFRCGCEKKFQKPEDLKEGAE